MTDDVAPVPATAVVCTRDRVHLLERVVVPLHAAVAALPGAELVIVQQGEGDVAAVCARAGVDARIVRDRGTGASRARNVGWRAARGEVVAFTDDDCVVPLQWLVDHVRALDDVGVVASCGQVVGLSRYGGEASEVWDRTAHPARRSWLTPPWEIGHSANLAVRREALEAIGGFDERLGPGARTAPAGEDADLLIRLLELGDAQTGVGESVRHVDWRRKDDHVRTLLDYELGAGAWIGKLGVRHPRVAASMGRRRLQLLQTSSPWSERGAALRDRLAFARGLALGAWLGIGRQPGRDPRPSCEHSSAMTNRSVDGMRTYWDERAKENAAWYVDTSLSYDDPDMEQFWQQGARIVEIALDEPPATAPSRHELAVEIGSGLGRNCKALAARFDRVVGVDIAPEMVRRATELVPEATFELVDGASLAPVASGTADFVFSFTVFQHIPDVAVIEQYIEEAGRVLRSGGVFAFQWNNEPGHLRWKARRTLLAALQRTGLRREQYARHAPQFLGSKVPVETVKGALARGGLELATTRDLGSLYAWAWAVKP